MEVHLRALRPLLLQVPPKRALLPALCALRPAPLCVLFFPLNVLFDPLCVLFLPLCVLFFPLFVLHGPSVAGARSNFSRSMHFTFYHFLISISSSFSAP